MGYEVDFFPVGEKSCSGDAIALRYGNLTGPRNQQFVAVVDGGYLASGEKVVQHIQDVYNTDTVDLVVSTHPDADHASGLTVVLESLKVGALWMHKPWDHTYEIASLFQGGRVTDMSIRENVRKALDDARELERIAKAKGILITEPFSGLSDPNGVLRVMGPSLPYYESLLPDFRCTPDARAGVRAITKAISSYGSVALEVLARVAEAWDLETLTDKGETSAEYNSGTIICAAFDAVADSSTPRFLFTADTGIPALTQAADYLDFVGLGASSCGRVQIPHHGSRRNVGPTILNRLVGPRVPKGASTTKWAYVSACKDGEPKHPSKRVTNAFKRRGAEVHGTMNGKVLCSRWDAPDRLGWVAATPVPFYDEVEETDED